MIVKPVTRSKGKEGKEGKQRCKLRKGCSADVIARSPLDPGLVGDVMTAGLLGSLLTPHRSSCH